MRVVMMGTGLFAEPTFEALLAGRHEVAGLVTQPDRVMGQERGSTRQTGRGMKAIAQERGLPVLQFESVNTPEGVAGLQALRPDLLVVAAYGQILSKDVLAVPPRGGINVHASLLPKYRGAAPIAWAIYHGETRTGVTIIRMSVHLDAGDLLAQQAVDVGPEETAGELEARLAPLGARLALDVIDRMEAGTLPPGTKQDPAQVTKAPKLTKEHGVIDWTRAGEQVCRQVRAMQPWPTAYTFWHRQGQQPLRLIVHRAAARPRTDAERDLTPGQVVVPGDPSRLGVAAGEGSVVEVLELQPAGKRRMAAEEFLRGRRPQAGDRLGPEQRPSELSVNLGSYDEVRHCQPDHSRERTPPPARGRRDSVRQGRTVMAKHIHEIRDAIHGFIRVETPERKILDSRPFQRLRHVHQLAMTYLIYPGATHRRFEHSLGVMELAGRVFDVITHPANADNEAAREVLPGNPIDLGYWRRVVRMAALCHDIGHLPFSHSAEELLPEGWDHERLSDVHILGDEMKSLWQDIKVQPADVAKLALGPKKFGPKKHRMETFTPWEAILSEVIVGDAFGVDRMDYLLRDSHHAGVAYGKFDHFRLIDTLRILPKPGTEEPMLGIESGGVHSAEALLLARYFMYTQLYFHPVRRIYDFHLREFLRLWLKGGKFSTEPTDHLRMTDNEVTSAILSAADDPRHPAHEPACSIVRREHFRLLYQRNPEDVVVNPRAAESIARAAANLYKNSHVHYYAYTEKNRGLDFPVRQHDGRVVSCLSESDVLKNVPVVSVDYVYIAPKHRQAAERWLAEHREEVIAPKQGAES